MMEEQDYEYDYLRDQAIIEAEKKAQMEAEWQELGYNEKQLDAHIEVLIKIKNEEEVEDGRT